MRGIIGGIISLAIGGTIFAVSQTDIVKNFSENTGMTQEQAQEYVNNVSESDLASFSDTGKELIDDGNLVLNGVSGIDCVNYTYEWETPSLSCRAGKAQAQKLGNDEITLGTCYQALDTDLGELAKTKISQCISNIDTVNSDYSTAIVSAFIDPAAVTEIKNTNEYNKSILESALEAK